MYLGPSKHVPEIKVVLVVGEAVGCGYIGLLG
jgi:hypothetical protein